jgi:hypothetical protein
MRGAGPVIVGKELVYAYYTVTGPNARVRMSGDESDRLDLFEGKQIYFGLPGQEVGSALLTAVVPNPPFVWVEMMLTGNRPIAGTGR